jgi:hypothetical protein
MVQVAPLLVIGQHMFVTFFILEEQLFKRDIMQTHGSIDVIGDIT